VSMSRETTFDRDLHAKRDKAALGAIFTQLAEQVATDLQRKGYVGRTIGIKLRFEDFKTVTRDMTVDEPTAEAGTIRLAAGRESALADFLSSAFLGGADGMMIGGYLTQRGRSPEADLQFAEKIKELWSI